MRYFLGGQGIADVITPCAVDVQLPYPDAFLTEAEFLHDAP